MGRRLATDKPIATKQAPHSPRLPQQRITDIWHKLIGFQKEVFGRMWPRDKDEMIQRYVMLLTKEAFEVLDHTSFKHHKPKINFDEHGPDRREEIADVVIYALELAAIEFGSIEALLDEIERKAGINDRRLDDAAPLHAIK